MTTNNYKLPGTKMTSRCGVSHKHERELAKQGIIPSAAEAKVMGRDPSMSAKERSRRARWSLRQWRVREKRLPVHDMDGLFYEEA